MSAEILEDFVKSPSPGFRCYAAGDESGPRFLSKVRHILHPPASLGAIAHARQILVGKAAKAVAFYQRHDGFILYHDTLSEAAGIELLRVEQWKEATDDMRVWFRHLAEKPAFDPDHIFAGIAIATVPQSVNYFVMPIKGPNEGKVFYADHDGWYESAFADDFDGFLAHVTGAREKLLAEELGCYTRFSDGETDAQWIPEAYFSDISLVQL